MRIGITGAQGYVGRHLSGYENVVPIQGDITNYNTMLTEVRLVQPDIVIHLAAKTDIDYCETHVKETEDTNFWGVFSVANACHEIGCGMVLLSSFQVFDGKRWIGDRYDEQDVPKPLNIYGLSKLTGESVRKAFGNMKVVRAGYLYDKERLKDRIDIMQNKQVEFPTFMLRSFMHIDHFCDSLMKSYVPNFTEMPELLHIGTNDTLSWFDFMSKVSENLKLRPPLKQTKEKNDGFAPRPHRAGLDSRLSFKLGFHAYSCQDGLSLL